MKTETMSLHEKLQIGVKSVELEKGGDCEGAEYLMKSIPLSPNLAKLVKDWMGTEFLLSLGWNLADAEAEFGSGWLSN